MAEKDLFGKDTVYEEIKKNSPYKDRKRAMNFRKASNKEKSCDTCKNHFIYMASKRFHKCKVLGDSRSQASDVKKSGLCDLYDKMEFNGALDGIAHRLKA